MSAIRFYALGITGCIASWTWIAMSINQCGQGIYVFLMQRNVSADGPISA